MRQFCTIQTIKNLEPIPNKDRIVYASFENTGWKVIVSSTMAVGEKVIFIEADSILPVHPVFEFLRSRCFSPSWNGFVVRNMKMASLYSCGLALPLSTITEFDPATTIDLAKLKDGDELTDFFKIRKYDPEEQPTKEYVAPKKKHPLVKWFWSRVYRSKYLTLIMNFLAEFFKKKDKEAWPEFLSKTDETRVQTLSYVYEKYAGESFYASEKMDGSSCTFAQYKKEFYVCSRNKRLMNKTGDKKDYWWNYAKANDVESKIKAAVKWYGHDICVQGELLGPSIQGNKYKLTQLDYRVFNVRDLSDGHYFSVLELQMFCERFGFTSVPILKQFPFDFENIDELLEFSKGNSVLCPTTIREGIVLRPVKPMEADRGQSNMCSFKVINPDFDIKYSSEK